MNENNEELDIEALRKNLEENFEKAVKIQEHYEKMVARGYYNNITTIEANNTILNAISAQANIITAQETLKAKRPMNRLKKNSPIK